MNLVWTPLPRRLTPVLLGLCPTAAAADQPTVKTITRGLAHRWTLAFLPVGNDLVTERPGTLRVVEPNGRIRPPVQGLPAVQARGQVGLLDVVLARARMGEDATRLQKLAARMRDVRKWPHGYIDLLSNQAEGRRRLGPGR